MVTIYVDQSGKWEFSSHTVIGAAVERKLYSAQINMDTKNAVQRILGTFSQEKTRSKKKLIIRMFTYSVFLTISDLVREGDIIFIDTEYQGNENSIRDHLLYLFKRFRNMALDPKAIQFGHVGKTSLAHIAAHTTFTCRKSPDKYLKFEDYFKLLDKTEEIRKKALEKRKKGR